MPYRTGALKTSQRDMVVLRMIHIRPVTVATAMVWDFVFVEMRIVEYDLQMQKLRRQY